MTQIDYLSTQRFTPHILCTNSCTQSQAYKHKGRENVISDSCSIRGVIFVTVTVLVSLKLFQESQIHHEAQIHNSTP